MQLRPYQATALASVQAVYRSGRRRALLVAPTGSGKSAMTRYMLGRTSKRTLILCHRAELSDMICESLSVPHGVIGGSRRTPAEAVHVGMMQTVARRLADLPAYDWVISDEAHLAMCPTWRGILQHYDKAWHLGLSATPCRLDGQGLGAEYEEIVHGPSIRELTDRGFLAPCRVFAPPASVKLTRASGAEMTMAEAAEALDRPSITGDAVAHYHRLAPGRQGIVFCCSREHAEHVARDFTAGGIPAVAVDGSMSDRKQRIADFRGKRFQALINVDLLTTGFDCPQIEVGVFLRRTDSLALYLQMVGRILRIAPGKRDAILLDHVGNVMLHGLPDMDREWTLDGRAKRRTAISVAQCPKCYAAHAPAPRCPACGHIYVVAASSRRALERRAGELQEVDTETIAEAKATSVKELIRAALRCETDALRYAALDEVRKSMGYKSAWTFMQLQLSRRYRGKARAA